MTGVANMRHQPKWRRALVAGDNERRAIEMVILLRAGPYRRDRHHVRQIQCGHNGLTDIGVGVAGDGREPGIHGIQRFGDGHKAPALDDTLHQAQLFVGHSRVGIQRSEEHTSELQSLMRISYAVFCLKKKTINTPRPTSDTPTANNTITTPTT